MIFLVLSGKMVFPLPKNMILFFRRKMKMIFLKEMHGNIIFSVYLAKMVFFFLQICYYHSFKKAKLIFSLKKYT